MLADGRTPVALVDSLFTLAHERSGSGNYLFIPYTRRPRATHRTVAGSEVVDERTSDRLMHGGLRTVIASLLDINGVPVRVEIVRSSGDPQFDELMRSDVAAQRFQPARAGACPVPFFVIADLDFRVERSVRMGGP